MTQVYTRHRIMATRVRLWNEDVYPDPMTVAFREMPSDWSLPWIVLVFAVLAVSL